MRNQSREECLTSLPRFITCRGRPEKIYSDNFSTFVAASKWLKRILRKEKIHYLLAKTYTDCRFNLSLGPCWGGHLFTLANICLTKD